MNLYWGFGECYQCHDRQGPWVLEESKWYCESCHEKYIKNLLKTKIATPYKKDREQKND